MNELIIQYYAEQAVRQFNQNFGLLQNMLSLYLGKTLSREQMIQILKRTVELLEEQEIEGT